MNEATPDNELIQSFLSGNELAFNLLVRKHTDRVYNITRKLLLSHDDACDVSQRVFVKLYERLYSFNRNSAFTTWLYRITANEALNYLRSQQIRRWISLDNAEVRLKDEVITPFEQYVNTERGMNIEEALATLPSRQRAVFVFRLMEGMKYDEISTILNTSVGSLKASFSHALKKMAAKLKDEYEKD